MFEKVHVNNACPASEPSDASFDLIDAHPHGEPQEQPWPELKHDAEALRCSISRQTPQHLAASMSTLKMLQKETEGAFDRMARDHHSRKLQENVLYSLYPLAVGVQKLQKKCTSWDMKRAFGAWSLMTFNETAMMQAELRELRGKVEDQQELVSKLQEEKAAMQGVMQSMKVELLDKMQARADDHELLLHALVLTAQAAVLEHRTWTPATKASFEVGALVRRKTGFTDTKNVVYPAGILGKVIGAFGDDKGAIIQYYLQTTNKWVEVKTNESVLDNFEVSG
eukprot:TRINITY_DN47492_c0_g1_i1.p1 TRINITY_DN47492_c0_g1~~TRINITY_DN47492_c0_g1_i1.p1  ORF type:complete len:281 (+),score=56.23 TRINITY_DN47492_c0_g1_i1:120-962(+)